MNRYQRELAQMDQRRQWIIRVSCALGAALLSIIVLWSAELSPAAWFGRVLATKTVEKDTSPPRAARQAAAPPAAVVQVVENPQVPPLRRLMLIATAPGQNAGQGTAQISSGPEEPQTYVGGAILANGARLEEIHVDHVVLERDGTRASLYVASLGRAAPTTDLIEITAQTPAAPRAQAVRPELTDVIRTSPQFTDDALTGVQMFPGRHRSLFVQLGLRPGDVIIAVEGIPIADADGVQGALETLLDGAAITLSVLRGGETVSLALDGAVVASALAAQAEARVLAGAALLPPP